MSADLSERGCSGCSVSGKLTRLQLVTISPIRDHGRLELALCDGCRTGQSDHGRALWRRYRRHAGRERPVAVL